MISVVIVTYNTREETLECLRSIAEFSDPVPELIVVDNASVDGTPAAVATAFPRAQVLAQDDNLGFAKGCNLGARAATGELLAFINSDCRLEDGALERLRGVLEQRPDAAAAVPRLVGEQGEVQRNVAPLPRLRTIASEYLVGRIGDPYRIAAIDSPTPVESCSGAALLIRRGDFDAIGGWYEPYFMYVEDVELSFRLRDLGRAIVYVPDARIFHAVGGSSGPQKGFLAEMLVENRKDYVRRRLGRPRALLALAAMAVGSRIEPLRNALMRRLRGDGR